MRSIRFRTRLLSYFWLILIIALGMPTYYIYHALEKEILQEQTENGFTQLEVVDWLIHQHAPFENARQFNNWCTELGQKLKYRITLISANGKVAADSSVPFNDIENLENHADREEFIGARQHGKASSIRYSVTVKRKLIYAAKAFEASNMPEGVLRVAIPLSSVESRLAYFAHRFWFILLVFLLITGFLNYLLARNMEAPIQKIIKSLRSIGDGKYDEYVDIDSGFEFFELSTGINEMTGKIRQNIAMISQQKLELEAVLEGMQEGVMLLDASGKIKTSNEALSFLAKCVPTCVGHRPLEVFLNPEIQAACDAVLKGETHVRLRVSIDAETIYEVNVVSIPSGGAVAVFHDISELIRLEKVRQDFVANVSHELRTPLTSIKGYAETLLDKKMNLSETAEKFLQTILKNANQMSNIVNDLLELTKLQQKDQQPLNLSKLNAISCFNAAWETCLPMASEKGIHLESNLPESAMVIGEENALIQVFRNLLDNAIRHSEPNTTITVFLGSKNGKILFGIQDEGPGIPKRHQKRIFERFYRVDKERSKASGGTGLGLAICRHAVLAMNGEIWVESPPDQKETGSVFFFTLDQSEAFSEK
jgi:two-component system, OmpR family, phosphate regulon sensor histidine kinase PhoR